MRSKVESQKLKVESQRSKLWLCTVWLLLLTFNFRLSTGFPQQPQAQAGQPIYPINAKYVQGFGPGYWPTAGSQLTLNLAPGTAVCRNTVQTYTGGTLTLTASTTNYVYLDAANNCTPTSNTVGFSSTSIPIAQVTTGATAITSITDVRTMFVANASGAVTSVGMTGDGVIFNTAVQGSPITTSGTLIPQLLTQTANRILGGPSSGSAAAPTFRSLVGADLPTPSANALGGVKSVTCGSGQFVDQISTSGTAACATPTGGGGSDYGLGNGTTVIDATLYAGADFGSKVNAAIAALPSTGGTVDARGLGGNQNMSVSIVLGTNTTLLLPVGTVTRASGAQFITGNGGIVKGAGKNLTYVIGNDNSAAIVRSATGAAQEITGLTIQNSGLGPCVDLTYGGSGTLNAAVHDNVFECATGLIFLGYYNRVWNNTFLPNPSGVLWSGVLMDGTDIVNSNHLWDNVYNGGTGTGVFTRGGYANTFDGKPDAESIGLAYFVDGGAEHIHDLYTEAAGCTSAWAASTQYGLGAILKDSNNNCEVATAAGISGSGSHPTWATNQGDPTTDNTVTWMMYNGYLLTSADPGWPGSNSIVLAPGSQTGLVDGVGNGALDLDLIVNGNYTNEINTQGNSAWGSGGISPQSVTADRFLGFLLGPYNNDSGYNARASFNFRGLIQGGSALTFYGPEVDGIGTACSAGGVCGHLPFHIGLVHSSAGIQDFGSVMVNPLPTPAAPTLSYSGPSGANSYTFYLVANVAGQQTLASTGATIHNVGTLSASNCITVQVPTTYQYTDPIRGDSFPDLWSTVRWDILLGDTAHSVATRGFVPSTGYSYCGGATSGYSAPTRNSTGDASFGGKLTTANNTLDDGSGNASFTGKVTSGTAGFCISTNCVTSLTQGTVTSVGLSMPAIFSVSGSPVTSSGTLTASWVAQNANLVFAGPSSGSAAAPTFRTLVGADLPTPTVSALGGLKALASATSHDWVQYVDTSGTQQLSQPGFGDISGTIASSQYGSQTANYMLAAPNGSSGNPTFRALVGADLPNPSASTLGGVESIASASHNWISYIDTSGVPHQSQPALSDLTATFNSPLSLSTNTLSCTNCVTGSSLTSGQLVTGNAGSAIQVGNLSGDVTTSGGTVTVVGKVNGVAYPASPSTNQVPVITGANTITYEAVPNAALANSSVTLNGQAVSLGSSGNVNSGATAHSVALNQSAGSAITGVTLGAHQTLVGAASADPGAKTIPDCQDSSGNHLNYTQTTDAFSCGTSGGAGGGANLTLSNLTSPTAINLTTLTFAGAAGITASGTNQNVTLMPNGTGIVNAAGGSLLVAPTAVYGGDSTSARAQVKSGLDILGQTGVTGGDAVLWMRTATGNAQFLYYVDDASGWGVFDAIAGKQPLAVAPASPDYALYIRPAGVSINSLAAAASNYLCYNTTVDSGFKTVSTCSTLPASLLPAPTASTLGGIESIASTSHQWVSYIDTSGVPHESQPAYSDLSGYPSHTSVVGQLSADVTMTTANTFYDGPSTALTAGTWLLNGSVDLQTTSVTAAVNFTCKLWDGTTVGSAGFSAIGATSSAAVKNVQMALTGIASPGGAATWKISCTSTTASQLIKAAPSSNSPGNYASTLVAVRIQ